MKSSLRKQSMFDLQLQKDPGLKRTESLILVLLVAFVAIRFAPAVLQTIYVARTGAAKIDCLMNYILIVLDCLFAIMIAQGSRFFLIPGGICSAYSLIALWMDTTFPTGSAPTDTPLYRVYTIVLIAVSAAQILIMLFLALAPRCRKYMKLLDSINKDYFTGPAT